MGREKLVVVELPKWLGTRAQARRICAPVPLVADNCVVVVEGEHAPVPDQEFCEELVNVVLCERKAAKLVLHGLPKPVESLLASAAARSGVGNRLGYR